MPEVSSSGLTEILEDPKNLLGWKQRSEEEICSGEDSSTICRYGNGGLTYGMVSDGEEERGGTRY